MARVLRLVKGAGVGRRQPGASPVVNLKQYGTFYCGHDDCANTWLGPVAPLKAGTIPACPKCSRADKIAFDKESVKWAPPTTR